MGKVLKFVRKSDINNSPSHIVNTDPKGINSIPVFAILLMCPMDRMQVWKLVHICFSLPFAFVQM